MKNEVVSSETVKLIQVKGTEALETEINKLLAAGYRLKYAPTFIGDDSFLATLSLAEPSVTRDIEPYLPILRKHILGVERAQNASMIRLLLNETTPAFPVTLWQCAALLRFWVSSRQLLSTYDNSYYLDPLKESYRAFDKENADKVYDILTQLILGSENAQNEQYCKIWLEVHGIKDSFPLREFFRNDPRLSRTEVGDAPVRYHIEPTPPKSS